MRSGRRGRRQQSAWRDLGWALLAVLALLGIGTAGFVFLTGASVIDALYMTVITISTVGFEEAVPIESAWAKAFTASLIFSALLVTALVFRGIAELAVADVLGQYMGRRRMQGQIDRLSGHAIVCGYGRMGRGVVGELEAEGHPLVVIEPDEETSRDLANQGYLVVWGDGTRDGTLRRAGIERAGSVIAVAGTDETNIVITLSSRALNPDLRIASRAGAPDAERKLRRAGANYVLHYHGTGATHLALAVTHPVVEAVLNRLVPRRGDLDLGQIRIEAGSRLAGQRLSALAEARVDAIVLAIQRDGELVVPPQAEVPLEVGDVLVVAGRVGALDRLLELSCRT